jgi:hypothetical protein
MFEDKYILGAIAVVLPVGWAWWTWYWRERKVRLSVLGYKFKYKRDKARVIRGVDVEIIIYNYDDRPLGIAEGGMGTNYDSRGLFVEIYRGYQPMKVLPGRTITLKKSLNKKGEKIKDICLYLADDRRFNVKGNLIKRLNQRLVYIGTRYEKIPPEAKQY